MTPNNTIPPQRPALVVGLTGGIASGKSTVEALFRKLSVPVIDADQIARDVVQPGQAALTTIAERFGPDIIQGDGHLDRSRLRQQIFSDAAARADLEAILHPPIRRGMIDALTRCDTDYAILSVPLLLESGQQDLVDRILIIDLPVAVQRQRLMQRDSCPADEADAIIASQTSASERRAAADDLIDNRGPPDALAGQITDLHQRYIQLSRAQQSP